jgi:hypothetical protein
MPRSAASNLRPKGKVELSNGSYLRTIFVKTEAGTLSLEARSGSADPKLFRRGSRWGVVPQIIRFARFSIRRPYDHTPNLAFGPDQNVRL